MSSGSSQHLLSAHAGLAGLWVVTGSVKPTMAPSWRAVPGGGSVWAPPSLPPLGAWSRSWAGSLGLAFVSPWLSYLQAAKLF